VVWRVRVVAEHDRHGQPLAASAQLHAASLTQSHGGRLATDPPDLGAVSGSPVKKYSVSGRGRQISIAALFRPRGRRSSIDRCRSPRSRGIPLRRACDLAVLSRDSTESGSVKSFKIGRRPLERLREHLLRSAVPSE
jgi:hypothetical protein